MQCTHQHLVTISEALGLINRVNLVDKVVGQDEKQQIKISAENLAFSKVSSGA